MALSAKTGSFAAATSTGNQAVTGVGFTPKALILWGVQLTADGYGAGISQFFGCATASTDRWAMCEFSTDAAATSATARGQRSDACVYLLSSTTVDDAKADLVSFDADGFTINWSDAPASAWQIHYLALGGASLTNAKAGTFSGPAAAGAKAVTGVGFTPDVVIVGNSKVNPANGIGLNGQLNLSAFTTTDQVAASWRDRDGRATMVTASSQRTDLAVMDFAGTSDALANSATFTSMDADGFTLNYSATSGAENANYLALKLTNVKVGAETQNTTTGTKSTTGLGFRPAALLAWSWGLAASASVDSTSARLSIGAATEDGSEGGTWVQSADNVADADDDSRTYSDKVIGFSTQPSTTNAEADASMTSDGFDLNWTTADATARQFLYIALGPGTAPAASAHRRHGRALTGVGR